MNLNAADIAGSDLFPKLSENIFIFLELTATMLLAIEDTVYKVNNNYLINIISAPLISNSAQTLSAV